VFITERFGRALRPRFQACSRKELPVLGFLFLYLPAIEGIACRLRVSVQRGLNRFRRDGEIQILTSDPL
jgi:hypothetical protein